MAHIRSSGWCLVFTLAFGLLAARAQTPVIDGSRTNQTIAGFGANIHYHAWNNDELKPVIDALISQGHFSLFRIIFDNTDWEAINDDTNSTTMNWDFYNPVYSTPRFEKLWGLIGYLNQKGITNGVMLNFQGPGPAWMGQPLTPGYEDEWAEMIASLLIYARNTRHLQFSLVGPDNEPDLSYEGVQVAGANQGANQYVTMLHKLAVKLDAAGLSDLRFVGPDRASAPIMFVPQMTNDPVVMAKLAHFGMHSYSGGGGDSSGMFSLLQQGGYTDRGFWVTEFNVWCTSCESGGGNQTDWTANRGTAEYLLAHLANGASAGFVWEGYDSIEGTLGPGWSYWGLFAADSTNAAPMTYSPRKDFFTLAQVASFVAPGAQRISISGTTTLQVLAFYDTNCGRLTLTGVNTGTHSVNLSAQLTNLPAVASLDLYYTSSATNLAYLGAVPVSNGVFTASIPADCVFALKGFDPAKIAVSIQLTTPLDGTNIPAPATIALTADASTVTGLVTNVEFYAGTNDLGGCVLPPYAMVWTNVPPGNYALTALATDSTGNTRRSPPVHATVLGPPAQITVAPANTVLAPLASQSFTAVASDALGNPIVPAPPFTWWLPAGGVIDSNGFFVSDGTAAGPINVTASFAGLIGAASVSVNLAASGTGYAWYNLATDTGSSPQTASPAINDGDLVTDVWLAGGDPDGPNCFEAAGVVWPLPATVNRVVYVNGAFDHWDNGVFSAAFQLQFSTDGVAWADAPPTWKFAPKYAYSSPAAGNVSFTFTGPTTNVSGVRCVGQVHTSSSNSWAAAATELQAFMDTPALQSRMDEDGLCLTWPGSTTNFVVEYSPSLAPPVAWQPLTNTAQVVSGQWSVYVSSTNIPAYFRLRR